MKKNIFYWSPFLSPVGTVKSTLNSAISLKRFNKEYEVSIINACGEWDNHKETLEKNSIELINLNIKYYKILPKRGFIGSRLSYITIFLLSFFPLILLLKRKKPNKIMLHLITSLPLTLLNLFKFKTDFILRISGYPKLNLIRKIFWRLSSKKLKMITCPTSDLKKDLEKLDLFDRSKLHFLPDAIVRIRELKREINFSLEEKIPKNKKIILSAGRLTNQKNYVYLINEFFEFSKTNDQFILLVLGDGEKKNELLTVIKEKGIEKKVFLLGHKNNIYSYMRKCSAFVLSSLWEEVGFVIVEAALCNLLVIASDCPNGPKEFLDNGKKGILFESNEEKALFNSFKNFSLMDKKEIFQIKTKLKKAARKYTIFNHQIELNKILKL